MSVNLPQSVKGIVTPSGRDLSQDCTSMIMPSGVSSFLLDCMASDLETGDPLPSIETLCKADTYDEGTGLFSEDEMLHCYIKNSTLLSFSDAVNIGMQHPPNLSSILELSPVFDRQAAKESFSLTPPQPVSPIGSLPLVGPCEYMTSQKNTSGGKRKNPGFEERTPLTKIVVAVSPVVKKKPFTGKPMPIKCRKVTFSDVISMQTISVINPGSVKPQRRAYNVHKNDMKRTTQEASSETARFFDFADECEKEAFFQRLKLTYIFQLPAKLITLTDLSRTVDLKVRPRIGSDFRNSLETTPSSFKELPASFTSQNHLQEETSDPILTEISPLHPDSCAASQCETRTCGNVSDHCNWILDVPVGILFKHTNLQPPNSLHLNSSIGIILEGQVIMDKMPDLTQAMCLLFGLIYALDLNYPKSFANTFDFIQRVLMSMGQNALKTKVQSLANQLFC